MVADLFLYDPESAKEGLSEDELRERLKPKYTAAQETFNARVEESVRRGKDYLRVAFDKAVRKRARGRNVVAAPPTHGVGAAVVGAHPVDTDRSKAALSDDELHHRAASLASAMIADFFLDQWENVERGVRSGRLREALAGEYESARRTFEAQIPEAIWGDTHYLDIQFDQVLSQYQSPALSGELTHLLRARLADLEPDTVSLHPSD